MVSAIEKQVLQSQVVERIQQVQQQHPDMQQQYFKIQFGQERRKLSKKVNESGHIHHAAVDTEEDKKRRKDHLQGMESTEAAEEGAMTGEPEQRDHIDIKV
jgi:hypothetical protein